MSSSSLVRDEGVAGSNPATPTSFPAKSDRPPDSFPDSFGACGTITIEKQVAAVERAAMNWRGHVNNLRDLAARGKRPQLEYDMAAAWLPDLEAAAVTMRELANTV